jgi:hypothetical protein
MTPKFYWKYIYFQKIKFLGQNSLFFLEILKEKIELQKKNQRKKNFK